MSRTLVTVLTLLILGPVLLALDDSKDKSTTSQKKSDKPKADKQTTPEDAYEAVANEFQKARQAFSKEYREAKTDDERQKVMNEKYPKIETYTGRMIKLAEDNPKDPVAEKALTWIMQFGGYTPDGQKAVGMLFKKAQEHPKDASGEKMLLLIVQFASHTPDGPKAMDLLLKEHMDSKGLAPLCQALERAGNGEKPLREILEKNPHKDVQGQACFSLAQNLKSKSGPNNEAATKDAEKYYQMVIEKYADLKHYRGTLGKAAEGALFELRNLSVGKPVPDIEGEDIDGKKFKLSEYVGKVVILDFWGNW